MNAWPPDWDERTRGKDCAMCREGRPADNGFGVRIFEGARSDAYLQRGDVGHPGYTIVIWRGSHVAEPTALAPDEASEYFAEVLRVARAIERHYRPLKLNLSMLGNSLPHLHTHIVPRYADDDAPGRPPAFMSREPNERRRAEQDVAREAAALRELIAR